MSATCDHDFPTRDGKCLGCQHTVTLNPCCRDAIASLLTPTDVAELLGVSRGQVWRIATAMGLGVRIGQPGREITLFTPADVERMKAR